MMRWSNRQTCGVLHRSSVLSEPVVLTRHLHRLLTKELAILVWSELLDVLTEELPSELAPLAALVTTIGTDCDVVGGSPIDPVGLDGAASDPGTSRAKLVRVPCATEAIVIWVLVHGQRLVVNVCFSGR